MNLFDIVRAKESNLIMLFLKYFTGPNDRKTTENLLQLEIITLEEYNNHWYDNCVNFNTLIVLVNPQNFQKENSSYYVSPKEKVLLKQPYVDYGWLFTIISIIACERSKYELNSIREYHPYLVENATEYCKQLKKLNPHMFIRKPGEKCLRCKTSLCNGNMSCFEFELIEIAIMHFFFTFKPYDFQLISTTISHTLEYLIKHYQSYIGNYSTFGIDNDSHCEYGVLDGLGTRSRKSSNIRLDENLFEMNLFNIMETYLHKHKSLY